MRTYKLYAPVTGSGNALCNVLISRTGRIKSSRWAAGVNSTTDNSELIIELSTAPAAQAGTNDTLNEIDEMRAYCNFTTSGVGITNANVQRLLDYPIAQGERLYLHSTISGTITGTVTCFVDVDEGGR